MLNNNYLQSSSNNYDGSYRAILLYDGIEARIFIPGMYCSQINESDLEGMKKCFPIAIFASVQMRETALIGQSPCYVVFENGDLQRPIVTGYFGKGIRSIGGSVNSNGSSNSATFISGNFSNNFVPSNISGVYTNIVFGDEHGTNTCEYLVLHTVAGPGATVSGIISTLQNKKLGIHGIIAPDGVYQTANWNSLQYHCGNGNKYSIGFEQLESPHIKWKSGWNGVTWDSTKDKEVKEFHDKVYNNAVNIFAQLAKYYNIPKNKIISHKEIASKFGGSDHSDPESLWQSFQAAWKDNKWTMDGFRDNVYKTM